MTLSTNTAAPIQPNLPELGILPSLEEIIALMPSSLREGVTDYFARKGLRTTEQVIVHNPWFYRALPDRMERQTEHYLTRALAEKGLQLSRDDDPSVIVVVSLGGVGIPMPPRESRA
jgi:hypothetical protein